VAEVENVVKKTDLAYISEQIPAAIRESLQGIARVVEIVRAMREFSHPGVGEKTAIDINRAIESTITMARNEWKYVAEIEMDLDSGLPLVPCLPGEFNQAILNVLVNAAHAIADAGGNGANGKGLITVATRQAGDWVEIRIGDTGPGIPEEIRPRIFDLFFTTKEVGRGTGQGLAIAHNVIVEKHDGVITFETEVGKGTTFIIRLPLVLDQIEKG
jgi:signal transduction histidine kinase